MKNSKVLAALAGAVLLFGSFSVAFASNPVSYHFGTITPPSGPDYAADLASPAFDGTTAYLLGFNPSTGDLQKYWLNSGLFNSGGQIDAIVPITNVVGLNDYLNDFNGNKFPFLYSAIGSATSTIDSLSSSISSLGTIVSAIGPAVNIAAFMGSNASTSPYIASSTQNGFMSATDKVKLDGLASRVATTSTRSIVTGTGATGFQVSSTRDAEVRYSSTIVTTSSIAGSQNGTVVLEIASTDSATPAAWSEIGRCTNGTSYTLAVAIQGVSTQACQITGYVPAGYYAKIRSINNSGTPTYTYNSGQEVLQ